MPTNQTQAEAAGVRKLIEAAREEEKNHDRMASAATHVIERLQQRCRGLEAKCEAALAAFVSADSERLKETEEAHQEAAKWKAEGDMYGWNFHKGRASGTVWASIIFFRVRRVLEAALASPSASAGLAAATPAATEEAGGLRVPIDLAVKKIRQLAAESLGRAFAISDDDKLAAIIQEVVSSHNAALRERADGAESDLQETRAAHSRICVGIKQVLGFKNWPTIDGNFQDDVVALVEQQLAAAERRNADLCGVLEQFIDALTTRPGLKFGSLIETITTILNNETNVPHNPEMLWAIRDKVTAALQQARQLLSAQPAPAPAEQNRRPLRLRSWRGRAASGVEVWIDSDGDLGIVEADYSIIIHREEIPKLAAWLQPAPPQAEPAKGEVPDAQNP